MAPPSPEQRLYDAAIRWSPVPGKGGAKELIDMAVGCCDSQAVTIVRDGASVHWDWHRERPIDRGLSFLADEYDAEVSRIGRAAS